MLKTTILLFVLIQTILPTVKSLELTNTVLNNTIVAEINVCEKDEYKELENDLDIALSKWENVEFNKFCKEICESNFCGFEEKPVVKPIEEKPVVKPIEKKPVKVGKLTLSKGRAKSKESVKPKEPVEEKDYVKSEEKAENYYYKRKRQIGFQNCTFIGSQILDINICQDKELSPLKQGLNDLLTKSKKEILLPKFCKSKFGQDCHTNCNVNHTSIANGGITGGEFVGNVINLGK